MQTPDTAEAPPATAPAPPTMTRRILRSFGIRHRVTDFEDGEYAFAGRLPAIRRRNPRNTKRLSAEARAEERSTKEWKNRNRGRKL